MAIFRGGQRRQPPPEKLKTTGADGCRRLSPSYLYKISADSSTCTTFLLSLPPAHHRTPNFSPVFFVLHAWPGAAAAARSSGRGAGPWCPAARSSHDSTRGRGTWRSLDAAQRRRCCSLQEEEPRRTTSPARRRCCCSRTWWWGTCTRQQVTISLVISFSFLPCMLARSLSLC